ncbi:DUF4190 domain-containing protein [Oscillospiraceae bacterium WX1]
MDDNMNASIDETAGAVPESTMPVPDSVPTSSEPVSQPVQQPPVPAQSAPTPPVPPPQQAPQNNTPYYAQPPYYSPPQSAYPPAGYGAPPPYYAQPSPQSGKATASLVLGIIGIVVSWVPWVFVAGLVCSIIGLVMGVGARKILPPGQDQTRATAGMVCSIIGLVISVVIFIIYLFFIALMINLGSYSGSSYSAYGV